MKLLIASNNAHKVREIKQILGEFFSSIASLREEGIDIDVVEDGTTFEENALKKARESLLASSCDAALSDDSGLEVDELGGAPGVYSARFAGEGHDDEANNDLLLERMQGVREERRTCRFVSAVAIVFRDGRELIARGEVEGILKSERRGDNGFGYDPLFYYPPFGKTFAELDATEKNAVSHRKRALEALKELL